MQGENTEQDSSGGRLDTLCGVFVISRRIFEFSFLSYIYTVRIMGGEIFYLGGTCTVIYVWDTYMGYIIYILGYIYIYVGP